MLTHLAWGSIFIYPGTEEYSVRDKNWVLGHSARDVLGQFTPHCIVTEWLFDLIIPEARAELFKPWPEPCRTCLPFELDELFLLGGMIKELLPMAGTLKEQTGQVDEKALLSAAAKGIQIR